MNCNDGPLHWRGARSRGSNYHPWTRPPRSLSGVPLRRLLGPAGIACALSGRFRLKRHGIPYTLTPGVPAFAAAAAALERELTVPGIAQSVVLTRMPGRASRMPEGERLRTFAASGATLAIHLAIHAMDAIVEELIPYYAADCPVAVLMRVSWPDQRILRGTLADIRTRLAQEPMERTALVFVGRALEAADFDESSLYSPDYQRRFRNANAN
jgi:precorrin-4/cobalt-precorrin-4 C11-methyltransferase